MKVFDKFIIGQIGSIEWCFENTHFIERLRENGIKKEYIVNKVMNEEPIDYDHLENEEYAVIYDAPPNKDYNELRLIFACYKNTINLLTIMPNSETATNRQKKKYQSDKMKNMEKKRLKAISKRKW